MIGVQDLDSHLLHEGLELGREGEIVAQVPDVEDRSEAISIIVGVQSVVDHVGFIALEEGAGWSSWVEGVSRRLLDDRLEDSDIYRMGSVWRTAIYVCLQLLRRFLLHTFFRQTEWYL